MKNNKKIIIIVSILILLLLSLIIYSIIIKNNKDLNSNSHTTTTTKESNLNPDPEIYSTVILTSLKSFNNCDTGYAFDFSSKNKLEYKDLNKEFIYNTIYNYLKTQQKIDIFNSDSESNTNVVTNNNYIEEKISLNDFLLTYQTLYGVSLDNINYDDVFSIGEYEYKLDNENIYYTKKTTTLNCLKNNRVNYRLISENVENDKIELTYIIYYSIFAYENEDLKEYATNQKDGEKICEADYVNNDDNNNKFTKYKFTFVRNGQTYIFDSVTLVND
jgi:uncharacterized protein YkuJ